MALYIILDSPEEGGPEDSASTFRASSHGDAWHELSRRLKVSGPRELTAVTSEGAEIRASLYLGRDYIRGTDGRDLSLPDI